MAGQEYGTVISTPEGPSTRRFSFVLNKGSIVRRGQMVQLSAEHGMLIGRVSDVYKSNMYYMRPETVSGYQGSGNAIRDIFPDSDMEYLVCSVECLGVFGSDGFENPTFPPSPGSIVSEPEGGILNKFFGFEENGLMLGSMPYHDMSVKLNLTKLFQKHAAILALSGAGKSNLSSVMIEELIRRDKDKSIAVIAIDPHGEYSAFARDPKFAAKVRVFSDDIKIGMSDISPYEFAGYVPGLASVSQERKIVGIFNKLRKEKRYSIDGMIEETEGIDNEATRGILLSLLEHMKALDLFSQTDNPRLHETARQGELSVIDLSWTTNIRKKQMIVAHIARKLFDARKSGQVPPFVLLIEEAHQFVPEKAKAEDALSRGIIQTIAREGRKFNASLCLISQRPVQLSTTVLSQCNTNFILRITNPYDLKHIGESSEGITKDVLDQISSLPVGTGLVVGEGVNYPLFFRIRKRELSVADRGSLEEAALEYYNSQKKRTEDAKEFM